MRRLKKRDICLCVCIVGIVLLLCYEFFVIGATNFPDESIKHLTDMSITRFIGGVIFLAMLFNLDYKVLNPVRKPFLRSIVFCLPAFAIAINNFPFSQVISGGATIVGPWQKILLLAIECLCVGFFEEMAFRGVVFLQVVHRRTISRMWVFLSVLISSAVFGLVHLINLYQSSPIPVLMQIGYSFLIGAMCSVILIRTENIWLCVVVHGLFNFCGAIVPECGIGSIWDTFTVIFTIVMSIAVTVYMVVAFFKADLCAFEDIFKQKTDRTNC